MRTKTKNILRTLVASVTSFCIGTTPIASSFLAARSLSWILPTKNSVAAASAAVAMVQSFNAYAQTAEEQGSTSGQVDPDDPSGITQGRAAAAAAMREIQRPGLDSDGFKFRIQRPDGSTWEEDFGTKPDGTTYTMSDLDTLRDSYGDELNAEVQGQNFSSPEADFMRNSFKSHGHTGMYEDPGIVATEDALRKMEYNDDFQTIYGECGDLSRGNQDNEVIPETDAQFCYRVESPPVQTCAIDNEIRVRATDNIPTAVAILLDRSGSMSGARLEAARAATLRIAKTLDVSRHTAYAVYAFGNDGSPSPGNYYTLTDFGESVSSPAVAARYDAMTANGGTPTSTTMDHISNVMGSRSEGRKIILVVTDGEPNAENPCPYSPTCTPRGVQANYNGIVEYAAVGIQTTSVAAHFDLYRIVSSTDESEISNAMYEILSEETGWFSIYNAWTPQTCINTAKKVEDGTYQGSLTCLDPPDASGCNEIDGLLVCDGTGYTADMIDPPVGGFSKVCGAVGVNDIRFCWTGVDGQQHCLNDDGTSDVPLCKDISADSGCGRQRSTCIESTRDENEICRVFYEEYACGRQIEDEVTAESGNCGEPMPCMGGECMDDPVETNDNFIDTMTVMQAVEWAGKDAENCDVTTGDCAIFRGEAYQCQTRKEYISIPCCNDPPDISLGAWIQVSKAAYKGIKASGAIDWLQANTIDTPGFWQDMYNGGTYVYDIVSKPFVAAWDSLAESGAGWLTESAGTEFAGTAVANFKQEMLNQAYRWINEFFPELANIVFQESATAAGNYVLNEAIVSQVASFASFMMTAYMYYQLAVIAYNFFADCQDNDGRQVEFNYKREKLRVCHMMSSRCKIKGTFGGTRSEYRKGCCFASPLSRILQQQIRGQLAMSWGSACNPSCQAITLADLQRVDWKLIDLSDWTAILFESGIFPDDPAEKEAMSNADAATTNREDESYYVPPSGNERYQNREQHVDWTRTQREHHDQAWDSSEDAHSVNRRPYGNDGTSSTTAP